jgi:hypothetical protein
MSLFETKSVMIMRALVSRFRLADFQAAAAPGNFGRETGGFAALLQGDGDGHGWAQWSGARRDKFLSFCLAQKRDWRSDDANLGFLLTELSGPYAGVITGLRAQKDVEDATAWFMRRYEAPGVPALAERISWARKALIAFRAAPRRAG